jgi:hypothetical protein
MSPIDVCIICCIFRDSGLSRAESGLDRELVETFSEFLSRTIDAYKDSLSLSELFRVYEGLLQLSIQDPSLGTLIDTLSDSLLHRIRSGEELCRDFPIADFIDTYMEEIDEPILTNMSNWTLKRVQYFRANPSLEERRDVGEGILAVQKCFDYCKIKEPNIEFIDAVRKYI